MAKVVDAYFQRSSNFLMVQDVSDGQEDRDSCNRIPQDCDLLWLARPPVRGLMPARRRGAHKQMQQASPDVDGGS